MTYKLHAYDMMLGNALTPTDPRVPVLLKATGSDPDLVRIILEKRAKYKRDVTLRQRKWQTMVSHRPQRGNHHDSHQIREGYVRC